MSSEDWVLVEPGGQVVEARPTSAAIESVARKVNKRRLELGLDYAIAMPRSRHTAMFGVRSDSPTHPEAGGAQ